jgi:hypothetical protein
LLPRQVLPSGFVTVHREPISPILQAGASHTCSSVHGASHGGVDWRQAGHFETSAQVSPSAQSASVEHVAGSPHAQEHVPALQSQAPVQATWGRPSQSAGATH